MNRKDLTDEEKLHFGDTLYPNNDKLVGLVGFINIQGLPIKRISTKKLRPYKPPLGPQIQSSIHSTISNWM
eukprot:6597351-Ditylum_brightwellii.AAC.1